MAAVTWLRTSTEVQSNRRHRPGLDACSGDRTAMGVETCICMADRCFTVSDPVMLTVCDGLFVRVAHRDGGHREGPPDPGSYGHRRRWRTRRGGMSAGAHLILEGIVIPALPFPYVDAGTLSGAHSTARHGSRRNHLQGWGPSAAAVRVGQPRRRAIYRTRAVPAGPGKEPSSHLRSRNPSMWWCASGRKRVPGIRVLSRAGPAIRNGGTWGYESLDVEFKPSSLAAAEGIAAGAL